MWGISLRECTQSVHKRNKSFIKKERRLRGITLHPDSDLVVKLPPGSLWTVKDVKRVFRKTLVASYIPLCVCVIFYWTDFVLLGWSPLQWVVFWTMAGAGLVASMRWRTSYEAVQPSLGCRNDMDMSIALHGSTLAPMSRLCEAAARPGYFQGDSLGI